MTNAAMNIHVPVFLHIYLRTEFLGLTVPVFNFLRNCQTVFQSGCIIFQTRQQCRRIEVSPHSGQLLLLSVFDFSFLTGNKVVSHCCFVSYYGNSSPPPRFYLGLVTRKGISPSHTLCFCSFPSTNLQGPKTGWRSSGPQYCYFFQHHCVIMLMRCCRNVTLFLAISLW